MSLPKVCAICGKRGQLRVMHLDGNESNGDKRNLVYGCGRRGCLSMLRNLPFKCEYCKTQYMGQEYSCFCENCGASLGPPRARALQALLG